MKFSIITPSLNQAAYLRECLESVRSQAEGKGIEIEHLVVDGGSTDGSVSLLEEWERDAGEAARYRFSFVSEPDGGQTDAINKGLAQVRGDIVAYLCADDFYESDALVRVAEVFRRHPEVEVVYGDYHFLEGDSGWKRRKTAGPYSVERLREDNFLGQSSVFWRGRVTERLGPLDARLRYCMDHEYWLRMAGQTCWYYLPEGLSTARLHGDAKTSTQLVAMWEETAGMAARYGLGERFRSKAWRMRCYGAAYYAAKRRFFRAVGKLRRQMGWKGRAPGGVARNEVEKEVRFGRSRVVVLVATYRRAEELERLGRCLAGQTHPVEKVVVVDNADDPATRAVVAKFPVVAEYRPMPENRGCGAGLRAAEDFLAGHAGEGATHWWILDDDAVPPPEALEKLLGAISQTGSGMAVPLLTDDAGMVWAFPEPVDRKQRRWFRQTADPAALRAWMGEEPQAGLWSTGACQLVRVEVARAAGGHRRDFWMLGEDLDFSMRVARGAGMVFLPGLMVPHLPPTRWADPGAATRDYAKFCALLQNLTYLSLWNPASAHLWRYLPGNYRRFFRCEGWSWKTLRDATDCFLSGLAGGPAGREWGAGARIRNRRSTES